MESKPLISIVLANYNRARFLDEAMASVVRQTVEDWELIVVDNGSTDNSHLIIERWAAADTRIEPIFKSKPIGCPAAVNLALATARGEFVARIDNDDLWYPRRLEAQLDFIRSEGRECIGVCGTDVVLIDAAGRNLGIKRYPIRHADCLRAIWYRNPFCSSAVLIRRRALDQCGGYDPAYALAEDLELWFRLGRVWEFHNLAEPLAACRIWNDSLTNRRLTRLAWVGHTVRRRAVRELGYRRSWLASAYSMATLGISLLPAGWVRAAFELGVSRFKPFVGDRIPQDVSVRGCYENPNCHSRL